MTSPAENPVLTGGELTDAERIAFLAGWRATETGNAAHPEGHETALRMYARGHNFGDEDLGEDFTRPGATPSQTQEGSAQPVTDSQRLDWLEMQTVNVRTPLRYGSRDNFWASPDDSYEGEEGPSDLRAKIDAAMAAAPTLSGGAGPDEAHSAAQVDGASSREEPLPAPDAQQGEGAALAAIDALLAEPILGRTSDTWERARRAGVRAAREAITSLASAPPQQGEGDGWRPIEDAPTDGTVIDVWRPESGRDTVFWGYPQHECGEMGSLCDDDWHRIPAPGWVCNTFGEFLGRKHAPFTHWRHLPSAPRSLTGEENG